MPAQKHVTPVLRDECEKRRKRKGLGQKSDDACDYREVRLKNRVFSKRDARRASSMDTQKRSAISHRNALTLASIVPTFCDTCTADLTQRRLPYPREMIKSESQCRALPGLRRRIRLTVWPPNKPTPPHCYNFINFEMGGYTSDSRPCIFLLTYDVMNA